MIQIAYAIYVYVGLVTLILVGFWFVSIAEERKSLTSLNHLLKVKQDQEISVSGNASRLQLSDAAARLGAEQLSISRDGDNLNHDIARSFILIKLDFMKRIAEMDKANAREQAQEKIERPPPSFESD